MKKNCDMLNTKIIKHSDLNNELLLEICSIKNIAWPYPLESQKQWLRNNLIGSDIHLLLYNEDILIAYLNLVNVEVVIDKNKVKALGVGNVCSSVRGKGYGADLMRAANNYILQCKKSAILFCNRELLNFHQKYDWIAVDRDSIDLPNIKAQTFEVMLYNVNLPVRSLLYSDRLF